MRYIDADIAQEIIAEKAKEPNYQHEGEDWRFGLCMAETAIEETPTADVAPKSEVAREIFEGIERVVNYALCVDITDWSAYTELKKKYTEL